VFFYGRFGWGRRGPGSGAAADGAAADWGAALLPIRLAALADIEQGTPAILHEGSPSAA